MRNRLILIIGCCLAGAMCGCTGSPVADGRQWAEGIRPMVQDRVMIEEQKRYRQAQDMHLSAQLNSAEEQKVPYASVLSYPADWPRISRMRDEEFGAK